MVAGVVAHVMFVKLTTTKTTLITWRYNVEFSHEAPTLLEAFNSCDHDDDDDDDDTRVE